MASLCTVLLSSKGEVRNAKLPLTDGVLTLDSIQKYMKRKETPERVCYYEYDHKVIFIFGYATGKKGKESKVELPDPHSGIVLYGDSLVVVSLSSKWDHPIPFTQEQWNTFYQGAETNEEEEEEEEEEEDQIDFLKKSLQK